jgi:LPXTG-motif cell wall-anchored protein
MGWSETISVSTSSGIQAFYITHAPANTNSAPHPPRLTSPSQLTTTSTAEPSSSPLTTPRIYRVGKLTQAEEIIEENNDIETLSQAVALFAAPKIVLKAAAISEWISDNNGGEQKSITISSTDSWQWTESLPMYDASGHKYYYWVEETGVTSRGIDSTNQYTVAYKFDDGSDDTTYCIDAELHGNGEITIRNTPKESQAGVLPESGSTGTRIYYIAGGMLLLLAAAGYWAYSIKRRRWYDE